MKKKHLSPDHGANYYDGGLGNITIGADVEFLVFDANDGVVSAETTFDGDTESNLGNDQESNIGEIRPEPCTDPVDLTNKIEKLIQKAASFMDIGWTMLGGSYHSKYPIGGHIHIGHPSLSNDSTLKEIARALDLYVSLPIMFIESAEGAYDRRVTHGGYGSLSDWRKKGYGIEYRTLPSWIVARRYTLATLSLAYITVWEYIHERRSISYGIAKRLLSEYNKDMFGDCRRDIEDLRNLLMAAKNSIRSFKLWPQFGFLTRPVWEAISLDRDWRDDWNILHRWPIDVDWIDEDSVPRYSTDFLCEDIAKEAGIGPVYIYGIDDTDFGPDVVYYGSSLVHPNIIGLKICESTETDVSSPSIGLSGSIRRSFDTAVDICKSIVSGEYEGKPIQLT